MSADAHPYPRPDWVRPGLNWQSLNGKWDFYFDDQNIGLKEGCNSGALGPAEKQIKVPFAFQTAASGINDRGAHEVIWYRHGISDIRTKEEITKGHRLIARFNAVDYEVDGWLGGHFVGSHRGGHVGFDLDLTDALNAQTSKNEVQLVLRVRDSPHDLTQPRGKQYWEPQPKSIWYTPTSGIWQSVWLESVPLLRIGDGSSGTIIRSNDIESQKLHCKIQLQGNLVGTYTSVEIESSLDGKTIGKTKSDVSKLGVVNVQVPMAKPDGELALWSPETPHLYDLSIKLYDSAGDCIDSVITTTGMRSLNWTNGNQAFLLNGKPYFQALVLDQGYWPETGLTPPSQESLRKDIELSKAMGFNGCRKHQKVEDPVFLFWADKLGYLVWGEMANAYKFDDVYVERFNQEWMEAVRRDINHPCVVTWTPGNESWGYTDLTNSVIQRNHLRSLYYMTKTLDPTRPINDNCGWESVLTDLFTFHDYGDASVLTKSCASIEGALGKKSDRVMFVPAIEDSSNPDEGGKVRDGAPVICTEFGGINIAPKEGEATKEGDWGYITATDPDELFGMLENLFMGIAKGITCGFVYTQLTDIEQEVNGLYTFNRVPKLDPAKVKLIVEKATETYYNRCKTKV
ncbi:glycoside hydrolase family 2 protein [Microthyrium microscopicum]|uniref:Glycoside hydrolase family 2 protein n=1 Tax=Microthyrium microscopicum TaxID=703497 RepID=A0A6A6UQC9_9PEZI|nr:glycoside hydrolase family 2 protein [Microthyrium microscopicum]